MAPEPRRAVLQSPDVEPLAPGAGRWPDFIGIGTIKSGTTWLWECLRDHPQLFLPRMKEIEYFDARYALGDDWYRGFFSEAGERVCGEISPQYVHAPQAFERIAPLAGRVRLVVCLRNPAERAFSHYLMDARAFPDMSHAEKLRDFEWLVREGGSKYLEYGHYAKQLEPYLERFGREAIHAVFYDDITDDPAAVVADVCRFLGVDDSHSPAALAVRVNAAKRYRSVRLFRTLQRGVRVAEHLGLEPLILRLKRNGLRDRVLGALETREEYEPLPVELRHRLVGRYAAGNTRLGAILGRDLSAWNVV
jgi:hypothetical protein